MPGWRITLRVRYELIAGAVYKALCINMNPSLPWGNEDHGFPPCGQSGLLRRMALKRAASGMLETHGFTLLEMLLR